MIFSSGSDALNLFLSAASEGKLFDVKKPDVSISSFLISNSKLVNPVVLLIYFLLKLLASVICLMI